MSQKKNIAFAFSGLVAQTPDKPAIIAEDMAISYEKLWLISTTFARNMRAHNIDRSSIVALDTSDMIVSLACMFATALLGAQFVSLGPGLLKTEAVKPTHFLISPEKQGLEGVPYILMDQTWSPKFAPEADPDADAFPGFANPEDPWWIIHTSGTTGAPKFLALSQRVVFDRSMAAQVDFVSHKTVLCSLFGCTARPFYVRATAALLNGCTIVDSIDVAFLRKHGVNLICGSPRQAVDWLAGSELNPKFALLQVSGAKLSDSAAAALLKGFESVEDVYGSSETNKSFVNVKSMSGKRVISEGKQTDSVVEIINEEFSPCKPGENGTVRIKNSYMASGYLNAPASTERAFQGGWFYPGDFATWGAAGELLISGRVDEIINLGGLKINPALIDDVLMATDGVQAAVCFRNPDPERNTELMAFVTLDDISKADIAVAAAHAACLAEFGSSMTPQQIFVIQDIPMTFDGVPRRTECQRLALSLPRVTS